MYDVLNKVLEMYAYKATVIKEGILIEDLQDKDAKKEVKSIIELIECFIEEYENKQHHAKETSYINILNALYKLRIETV